MENSWLFEGREGTSKNIGHPQAGWCDGNWGWEWGWSVRSRGELVMTAVVNRVQ